MTITNKQAYKILKREPELGKKRIESLDRIANRQSTSDGYMVKKSKVGFYKRGEHRNNVA